MGLDEYLINIHLTFFIMTMTKTNKRALLGMFLAFQLTQDFLAGSFSFLF